MRDEKDRPDSSLIPHPSSHPGEGPAAEYHRRLAAARSRHDRLERRLAWLGNLRFALVVAAAVLLWLTLLERLASPFWLALPALPFLVLSFFFARDAAAARTLRRVAAFYEAGLARVEERWAGRGQAGTEYLNEDHPYAADLDLFGRGSLFERLCDARTRAGRGTLARWLTAPAPAGELLPRQDAVRDLGDRLTFRERLALLGASGAAVETAPLAEWGEAPVGRPAPLARWVAPVLVGLTLAALAGWAAGWTGRAAVLAALLLEIAFALWMRPRVARALAGLHDRSRDLAHLTGMLVEFERETFASRRLAQLQADLRTDGEPAAARLAELARLVERLDWTRNPFFAVLAPFLLWTTRLALRLEEWRRRAGPALGRWLAVLGEAEALNALASYAYENPLDPFPEVAAEAVYEAVGLAHPLLPRSACVPNDVSLGGVRLLVVSGSNMSGKSTFLRTIGVNAVLGLAGAPVRAGRLRLAPLALGATLRIQDSLRAGRSRFFAEITRLREILRLTEGPLPVLFLLDEILHGTNSHDRRIGAEAVLRALLGRGAIGLVTTHDLALAQIADGLGPVAVNVHFEDELVGGELRFDYKVRPGVVRHSNALALMRAVGLIDSVPPPSPSTT
jgi:hypothetical protein